MYNHYQELLAERSMIVEPSGDGEDWSFRWYTDPISNGMSKWQQCIVHVSEGFIAFHGMPLPRDEAEMVAMDQAMQFVKERLSRTVFEEKEY
jgi:hypothetical protein